MQSSASSNLQNNPNEPTETSTSAAGASSTSNADTPDKTAKGHGIVAGVVASRVVFGMVLILSGWAKAVDPWGGLYKIADYFMAWGIVPQHEAALTLASLLATFEFGLGVVTVLGCYRRAVRWLAPAFMGFMTILSLYIWIADPVEDCGCFGDAIKLSNGATFLKNIVLMVPAVVLAKWNLRCRPFVKPAIQWIVLVASFGYIAYVQIVGYHVQPLVDFRPYPVGTDLAQTVSTDGADDITFIYEKDGQRQSFTANNLPDDTWTFVERVDNVDGDTAFQLSFVDQYGDDVTSEVIEPEGDEFILVVTDPVRHGISRSEMANRLSEYSDDHDAKMIALVAVPSDSLEDWAKSVEARYDVFSAEDTDLKMLARGEAAVVMLRNGVVQWKRNIYSLPPDFPDGEVAPETIVAEQGDSALTRWTFVWVLILVLIVVSPRIVGQFKPHKK